MENSPHLLFDGLKFRAINKTTIESIVNPNLYFAKPDTLNDPFDCRIDLRESFRRFISSSTDRRKNDDLLIYVNSPKFFESWDKALGSVGVFSTSMTTKEEDIKNTLLWSHYGDEHKGVCLRYKIPIDKLSEDKNFQFVGSGKVDYNSDAIQVFLQKTDISDQVIFIDKLIPIYLTTKSETWAPEREQRIIRREHGAFSIPKERIDSIVFGLRTPENDKIFIKKLAKDYCNCENIYQIIRSPNNEFNLDIVPEL